MKLFPRDLPSRPICTDLHLLFFKAYFLKPFRNLFGITFHLSQRPLPPWGEGRDGGPKAQNRKLQHNYFNIQYAFLVLAAFCFLVLTASESRAQKVPAPKREFRAAWIASVGNIDWPAKQTLSSAEQQASFIQLLDRMKRMGCNAVIMQIRPACDAFYASKYEPWSRYLTGKQGRAPEPYYDPLQFMIAEAHKRNMEFHAWFNPFRALVDSKKNPNPPEHVTHQHPDWLVSYGGKTYLNPGIPAAREYVTDVILDVVKRYDIDAVHLDDYFYPYRIANVAFGDGAAFAKYNPEHIADRDDWRRENVSIFIKNLNTQIKKEKKFVKLGISPFGVWRNSSKDPEGSVTRGGQTNYDDL
ncbi:MAG: family 10 glycosylhydrolase, partial [Chitinophagaceae bacterium]